MSAPADRGPTRAIVLSGGGARGAYEAGVLAYLGHRDSWGTNHDGVFWVYRARRGEQPQWNHQPEPIDGEGPAEIQNFFRLVVQRIAPLDP